MNRQIAENTVTEYLKPIYGFTLKRCKNIEDAEDLAQEIVLRAFRALLNKEDIHDVSKFIWTIAHNALNNYYRDNSKNMVGISIDEVAELIADPNAIIDLDDNSETIRRLQSEIAYLSKLQRKIVIAYYFENRKQADIAKSLGIPLGTVKWHLFEAKKELKRGVDMVRKTSELKFNPIKFDSFGISGSIGIKSPVEFLRSTLAQNICYCVRSTPKTVNEIADALGVSPVYVENEAEYLEEYGFLKLQKDKYIANFIINELTTQLLTIQNTMYERAAELFANELYDELMTSGILDDPDILCHQTDGPISLTEAPRTDRNFVLWALIPYIISWSGEDMAHDKITFEEVATIRPDGARNIVDVSVVTDGVVLPPNHADMNNWNGPFWNGNDEQIFWQLDSKWSDRLSPQERNIPEEAQKVMAFYKHEADAEPLSQLDYAWLVERGYVKTTGNFNGMFKSSWQIVVLDSKEIKDRLLAIGGSIKKKYQAEFDAIKAPYAQVALNSVPEHLRKVKEYELQSVLNSDGRFLCYCIVCLLKNGKLKEPTEGQGKALTTLIAKV